MAHIEKIYFEQEHRDEGGGHWKGPPPHKFLDPWRHNLSWGTRQTNFCAFILSVSTHLVNHTRLVQEAGFEVAARLFYRFCTFYYCFQFGAGSNAFSKLPPESRLLRNYDSPNPQLFFFFCSGGQMRRPCFVRFCSSVGEFW